MECTLVLKLREKRTRKARVSALWICTTVKKLASEDYPDSNFKASNLWMFCKIRFRKQKNQKATEII